MNEWGHLLPCIARTAYVLACTRQGLENEMQTLRHVVTGATDVGEKIMESWAVPGAPWFGTHADDKAKVATLCIAQGRRDVFHKELPGLQHAS